MREAFAFAERQFVSGTSGNLVAHIKRGKSALGGDIREVLNYSLAAAAHGTGVVKRLGKGVQSGESETVPHTLLQARLKRIVKGRSAGRIVREGLVLRKIWQLASAGNKRVVGDVQNIRL